MPEEIEKTLELTRPPASEPPGKDKDVPRHCSRWATASLWAGGVGLALALLAYTAAFRRGDAAEVFTLLGVLAGLIAVLLSLIALIRIVCSRRKRTGYGRALLALALGFITTAGLLWLLIGMCGRALDGAFR